MHTHANRTLADACRDPYLHGLGARGEPSWYEHPAAIVTGLLVVAYIFMPK